MRLAIPTWNDRVSPVFDTASRLVLVDVEQGTEQGRRVVQAGADPYPTQRVRAVGRVAYRCPHLWCHLATVGGLGVGLRVLVVPWVSGRWMTSSGPT